MYWMKDADRKPMRPKDQQAIKFRARVVRLYLAAILITFLIFWLTGCTALEPNSFRVEAEHISHMTQHEPFTDHPTNIGDESIEMLAHWKVLQHGYFEIGEGLNVSPHQAGKDCNGGLCGPREIFIARAGYIFTVRPE